MVQMVMYSFGLQIFLVNTNGAALGFRQNIFNLSTLDIYIYIDFKK